MFVWRVRNTANTFYCAVTSLFLHPSRCGFPTAVTLLYGDYSPIYVCMHALVYLVIYTCTSLPVVSSFSSYTCRFVVFVCVYQTYRIVEEFVVTSSFVRPQCSLHGARAFTPFLHMPTTIHYNDNNIVIFIKYIGVCICVMTNS